MFEHMTDNNFSSDRTSPLLAPIVPQGGQVVGASLSINTTSCRTQLGSRCERDVVPWLRCAGRVLRVCRHRDRQHNHRRAVPAAAYRITGTVHSQSHCPAQSFHSLLSRQHT